ncbi:hypothetical protein JCM14469_24970 [Desulfatiferula olefinivorans]
MTTLRPNAFVSSMLCLLVLIACLPTSALAHSTKGRVKVPLSLDRPGVDDVAFYVESCVHRTLYDDGTAGTKNRYVVDRFLGVDQAGDRLTVTFAVLDKKTNGTVDGDLTLLRGEDGIWRHRLKGRVLPVEVHTYVTAGTYYWNAYGNVITLILGVSGVGLAALLVYRKFRGLHLSRAAEESVDVC